MNIIQSIVQSITKPPEALHTGEAFLLWAYYEAVGETRSVLLTLLIHTEDPDLKQLIEHFIADVLEPQKKEVGTKMLAEGIQLPNLTPDNPKADPKQIPSGARFRDDQIANMIVVKIQGLLTFIYEGISRSIRDDVGAMFYKFQAHVLAQGMSLKGTMTQRGWLRVPPAFRREPVGS